MDQTHYEVLGLNPGCSGEEIRQAYRRLMFELHPDRNPGFPNRDDILLEVQTAYEVLSDPQLRREYHQSLQLGALELPPEMGKASSSLYALQCLSGGLATLLLIQIAYPDTTRLLEASLCFVAMVLGGSFGAGASRRSGMGTREAVGLSAFIALAIAMLPLSQSADFGELAALVRPLLAASLASLVVIEGLPAPIASALFTSEKVKRVASFSAPLLSALLAGVFFLLIAESPIFSESILVGDTVDPTRIPPGALFPVAGAFFAVLAQRLLRRALARA